MYTISHNHHSTRKGNFSVGQCTYPMVLPNVLNYNNNNNCKSKENDYCANHIQNRMIHYWGNHNIEAFPSSIQATHDVILNHIQHIPHRHHVRQAQQQVFQIAIQSHNW